MIRAVPFLLAVFLWPGMLWSQTLPVPEAARLSYRQAGKWYSSVQSSVGNDRKALAYYRRTITALGSAGYRGVLLADCYLKCGLLLMTESGQDAAINDFRQSVAANGTSGKDKDSILFQPYLYLGSIAYGHNDLDSARYFYRLAEDIHDRYPRVEAAGRLFNKFGALYYETGDYAQSIHYFEKALAELDSNSAEYTDFVVNYKNNIATALLKMGRYDAAVDLLRSLLKYRVSLDGLLFNLGKASAAKRAYAEALGYFRAIGAKTVSRYNALGQVFTDIRNRDSARHYLDLAMRMEATGPVSSQDAAITRLCLGNLNRLDPGAEKKEQAARYFQQAICLLAPPFADTTLSANPAGFEGLRDFGHLFESLAGKAAVLAERSKLVDGDRYLQWSLDTYVSALSLARHIERTYFSDDARLFLKNQVNPATAEAVTVALKLYRRSKDDKYLELAFGLSETSKASVLQAGLRNLALSAIPGLPAGLLQEEKKLKFLHARLSLAAASGTDSAQLRTVQSAIRDNAIALTAVQEKLDGNPAYHQLKFYSGPVELGSVQRQLSADQAMLCYYYTADSLVCFYATHNGYGYTSASIDSGLFARIRRLRESLETPGLLDNHSMITLAAGLSQVFLKPVIREVGASRKWIVIPFNETGYIPFEMLPLPGEDRLCMFSHAISYQYSATLLEDRPALLNATYQVLAFAPFAGTSTAALAFPPLPASGEEIRDLPGKSFTGSQAGKNRFLSLAGQFPVVHLATHAVASDADALGSYIAFYGLKKNPDSTYRMYEQEVYALDLKRVGLIILSACETGKGQLVNGEGILSLSRAFSYAGCRRVVTSLWKADDRSTAYIMGRLHRYLRQGRDVDEALQLAKKDYLEDDSVNPQFKTAYYWAHLVLIGDHQALVPVSFPWLIWIVCGGFFLSVLTIIVFFKKKARQKEFRPAMDMKRIRITDEA